MNIKNASNHKQIFQILESLNVKYSEKLKPKWQLYILRGVLCSCHSLNISTSGMVYMQLTCKIIDQGSRLTGRANRKKIKQMRFHSALTLVLFLHFKIRKESSAPTR